MKLNIILLLIIITMNSLHAEADSHEKLISQNGKYLASFVDEKGISFIQIQDTKSKKIIGNIELSIPYSMEWSKTSDSIFIIDGLSHATCLDIALLEDGKWIMKTYEGKSAITHAMLQDGGDSWEYIYKYEVAGNNLIAYFTYAFYKSRSIDDLICGINIYTIDLSNGKIKKTKHKEITYDKYEQLRCSAPWL